ncbi:MAG: CHAD domain-containing protein [Actinomycetota bacterium]|nr:CHAD domain-containing protein [Actinomycetota bacterium]
MTTGQGSKSSRTRESTATDHQEIEWQFDAGDLESVEGWLGRYDPGSSGLVVAPESTVEITDTYFDTDDWRFYRAGYVLRVRKTDGEVEATMKSLAPGEDSLRRRREISEPLEDDEPSALRKARGPVGGRSGTLVGGREIRRLFRIKTRRQGFALKDSTDEGVRLGEISLDASEIPLGEEPVRLMRVEVETGIGETPGLRGFVDEMQSALDLAPASVSKYETGLYASGLSPEGDFDLGPTHVEVSMSVGEVAFAVLRRQFAEMRDHEPGTRLGEDPEELHDMRVPTRRMRVAMKVFQHALPARARWLREELRWVAQALGDVRDLDVQIERFEAWKEEAGEESSEFLDRILAITHKRRAEARKNMLEILDSERYEHLESSLAKMLRRGPGGGPELAQNNGDDRASEPVTAAAPALISGRYRKWRKAAKRLDETSSPEAFHDVRKKGKRLRYTLEFVSEVYGRPVRKLVKPLRALQDDLGDHQDAVVAARYLQELGTTSGGTRVPRGVAFTMGVYSERCAREAKDLRSVVPGSKPFRTLTKRKRWKKVEKVLASRNGIPARGDR